jgi:hypothetical protein
MDSPVNTTSTKPAKAGGPPKGSHNALSHGLYYYKAVLDGDGLDERSSLFRALRMKEQELIAALGGDPSPQERTIISDSVKVMLYVSSCDNYLMGLNPISRIRGGQSS